MATSTPEDNSIPDQVFNDLMGEELGLRRRTRLFYDDAYDEEGVLVYTNHQPENLGKKQLPSQRDFHRHFCQLHYLDLPWWRQVIYRWRWGNPFHDSFLRNYNRRLP